jgi:hypothetical protein
MLLRLVQCTKPLKRRVVFVLRNSYEINLATFINMLNCSLLQVISTINGLWIGGDFTCRLKYGIRDVSFVASSLTMAIVGIERYVGQPHFVRNNQRLVQVLNFQGQGQGQGQAFQGQSQGQRLPVSE